MQALSSPPQLELGQSCNEQIKLRAQLGLQIVKHNMLTAAEDNFNDIKYNTVAFPRGSNLG